MSPSLRLVQLVLILLLLALALESLALLHAPAEAAVIPAGGALALALLVAMIDAGRALRLPTPSLTRQLPGNLPLGRWADVRLVIHSTAPRAVQLDLIDHVPDGMEISGFPLAIRLADGSSSRVGYRVRATQRGRFRFERCDVVLGSPLGLWRLRRRIALEDDTRVYPDFIGSPAAEMTGMDGWLDRLGIHRQARRGHGRDFRQLREYREGDTLRQIDWKATARMRTPIAREYQDERDQQLVMLLDCGRRMRSQDGELSHFDHALNACLLLSHVALRQGDAVGLETFALEQPRRLAPGKGAGQLRALLDASCDLQCTRQPSDYSEAAARLLQTHRRRALVVLFTNLRDEETDEDLAAALRLLGGRHQVLLASLRETVLDDIGRQPVRDVESALAYGGAMAYQAACQGLKARLNAQGIPVLESTPQSLGPALVERYLALKRAGTL